MDIIIRNGIIQKRKLKKYMKLKMKLDYIKYLGKNIVLQKQDLIMILVNIICVFLEKLV